MFTLRKPQRHPCFHPHKIQHVDVFVEPVDVTNLEIVIDAHPLNALQEFKVDQGQV